VVAESLRLAAVGGSDACEGAVRAAFAALGAALADAGGRRRLERWFNVCPSDDGAAGPLDDAHNRVKFSEVAADVFPFQDNDNACPEPVRARGVEALEAIGPPTSLPMARSSHACSVLDSIRRGSGGEAPSHSPGRRRRRQLCNYAKICQHMLGGAGGDEALRLLASLNSARRAGECVDASYAADVAGLTDTRLAAGDARVWFWQTCTEFAFYQTCDPSSQCPFTSTPWLDRLPTWCAPRYPRGCDNPPARLTSDKRRQLNPPPASVRPPPTYRHRHDARVTSGPRGTSRRRGG
jgi:serine protease 16